MSGGLKLLAREPTMAMRRAANERKGTGHPYADIWCAMWDAAAPAPQPAEMVERILSLIASEQRRVVSPEAVGALTNVANAINAMMEEGG